MAINDKDKKKAPSTYVPQSVGRKEVQYIKVDTAQAKKDYDNGLTLATRGANGSYTHYQKNNNVAISKYWKNENNTKKLKATPSYANKILNPDDMNLTERIAYMRNNPNTKPEDYAALAREIENPASQYYNPYWGKRVVQSSKAEEFLREYFQYDGEFDEEFFRQTADYANFEIRDSNTGPGIQSPGSKGTPEQWVAYYRVQLQNDMSKQQKVDEEWNDLRSKMQNAYNEHINVFGSAPSYEELMSYIDMGSYTNLKKIDDSRNLDWGTSAAPVELNKGTWYSQESIVGVYNALANGMDVSEDRDYFEDAISYYSQPAAYANIESDIMSSLGFSTDGYTPEQYAAALELARQNGDVAAYSALEQLEFDNRKVAEGITKTPNLLAPKYGLFMSDEVVEKLKNDFSAVWKTMETDLGGTIAKPGKNASLELQQAYQAWEVVQKHDLTKRIEDQYADVLAGVNDYDPALYNGDFNKYKNAIIEEVLNDGTHADLIKFRDGGVNRGDICRAIFATSEDFDAYLKAKFDGTVVASTDTPTEVIETSIEEPVSYIESEPAPAYYDHDKDINDSNNALKLKEDEAKLGESVDALSESGVPVSPSQIAESGIQVFPSELEDSPTGEASKGILAKLWVMENRMRDPEGTSLDSVGSMLANSVDFDENTPVTLGEVNTLLSDVYGSQLNERDLTFSDGVLASVIDEAEYLYGAISRATIGKGIDYVYSLGQSVFDTRTYNFLFQKAQESGYDKEAAADVALNASVFGGAGLNAVSSSLEGNQVVADAAKALTQDLFETEGFVDSAVLMTPTIQGVSEGVPANAAQAYAASIYLGMSELGTPAFTAATQQYVNEILRGDITLQDIVDGVNAFFNFDYMTISEPTKPDSTGYTPGKLPEDYLHGVEIDLNDPVWEQEISVAGLSSFVGESDEGVRITEDWYNNLATTDPDAHEAFGITFSTSMAQLDASNILDEILYEGQCGHSSTFGTGETRNTKVNSDLTMFMKNLFGTDDTGIEDERHRIATLFETYGFYLTPTEAKAIFQSWNCGYLTIDGLENIVYRRVGQFSPHAVVAAKNAQAVTDLFSGLSDDFAAARSYVENDTFNVNLSTIPAAYRDAYTSALYGTESDFASTGDDAIRDVIASQEETSLLNKYNLEQLDELEKIANAVVAFGVNGYDFASLGDRDVYSKFGVDLESVGLDSKDLVEYLDDITGSKFSDLFTYDGVGFMETAEQGVGGFIRWAFTLPDDAVYYTKKGVEWATGLEISADERYDKVHAVDERSDEFMAEKATDFERLVAEAIESALSNVATGAVGSLVANSGLASNLGKLPLKLSDDMVDVGTTVFKASDDLVRLGDRVTGVASAFHAADVAVKNAAVLGKIPFALRSFIGTATDNLRQGKDFVLSSLRGGFDTLIELGSEQPVVEKWLSFGVAPTDSSISLAASTMNYIQDTGVEIGQELLSLLAGVFADTVEYMGTESGTTYWPDTNIVVDEVPSNIFRKFVWSLVQSTEGLGEEALTTVGVTVLSTLFTNVSFLPNEMISKRRLDRATKNGGFKNKAELNTFIRLALDDLDSLSQINGPDGVHVKGISKEDANAQALDVAERYAFETPEEAAERAEFEEVQGTSDYEERKKAAHDNIFGNGEPDADTASVDEETSSEEEPSAPAVSSETAPATASEKAAAISDELQNDPTLSPGAKKTVKFQAEAEVGTRDSVSQKVRNMAMEAAMAADVNVKNAQDAVDDASEKVEERTQKIQGIVNAVKNKVKQLEMIYRAAADEGVDINSSSVQNAVAANTQATDALRSDQAKEEEALAEEQKALEKAQQNLEEVTRNAEQEHGAEADKEAQKAAEDIDAMRASLFGMSGATESGNIVRETNYTQLNNASDDKATSEEDENAPSAEFDDSKTSPENRAWRKDMLDKIRRAKGVVGNEVLKTDAEHTASGMSQTSDMLNSPDHKVRYAAKKRHANEIRAARENENTKSSTSKNEYNEQVWEQNETSKYSDEPTPDINASDALSDFDLKSFSLATALNKLLGNADQRSWDFMVEVGASRYKKLLGMLKRTKNGSFYENAFFARTQNSEENRKNRNAKGVSTSRIREVDEINELKKKSLGTLKGMLTRANKKLEGQTKDTLKDFNQTERKARLLREAIDTYGQESVADTGDSRDYNIDEAKARTKSLYDYLSDVGLIPAYESDDYIILAVRDKKYAYSGYRFSKNYKENATEFEAAHSFVEGADDGLGSEKFITAKNTAADALLAFEIATAELENATNASIANKNALDAARAAKDEEKVAALEKEMLTVAQAKESAANAFNAAHAKYHNALFNLERVLSEADGIFSQPFVCFKRSDLETYVDMMNEAKTESLPEDARIIEADVGVSVMTDIVKTLKENLALAEKELASLEVNRTHAGLYDPDEIAAYEDAKRDIGRIRFELSKAKLIKGQNTKQFLRNMGPYPFGKDIKSLHSDREKVEALKKELAAAEELVSAIDKERKERISPDDDAAYKKAKEKVEGLEIELIEAERTLEEWTKEDEEIREEFSDLSYKAILEEYIDDGTISDDHLRVRLLIADFGREIITPENEIIIRGLSDPWSHIKVADERIRDEIKTVFENLKHMSVSDIIRQIVETETENSVVNDGRDLAGYVEHINFKSQKEVDAFIDEHGGMKKADTGAFEDLSVEDSYYVNALYLRLLNLYGDISDFKLGKALDDNSAFSQDNYEKAIKDLGYSNESEFLDAAMDIANSHAATQNLTDEERNKLIADILATKARYIDKSESRAFTPTVYKDGRTLYSGKGYKSKVRNVLDAQTKIRLAYENIKNNAAARDSRKYDFGEHIYVTYRGENGMLVRREIGAYYKDIGERFLPDISFLENDCEEVRFTLYQDPSGTFKTSYIAEDFILTNDNAGIDTTVDTFSLLKDAKSAFEQSFKNNASVDEFVTFTREWLLRSIDYLEERMHKRISEFRVKGKKATNTKARAEGEKYVSDTYKAQQRDQEKLDAIREVLVNEDSIFEFGTNHFSNYTSSITQSQAQKAFEGQMDTNTPEASAVAAVAKNAVVDPEVKVPAKSAEEKQNQILRKQYYKEASEEVSARIRDGKIKTLEDVARARQFLDGFADPATLHNDRIHQRLNLIADEIMTKDLTAEEKMDYYASRAQEAKVRDRGKWRYNRYLRLMEQLAVEMGYTNVKADVGEETGAEAPVVEETPAEANIPEKLDVARENEEERDSVKETLEAETDPAKREALTHFAEEEKEIPELPETATASEAAPPTPPENPDDPDDPDDIFRVDLNRIIKKRKRKGREESYVDEFEYNHARDQYDKQLEEIDKLNEEVEEAQREKRALYQLAKPYFERKKQKDELIAANTKLQTGSPEWRVNQHRINALYTAQKRDTEGLKAVNDYFEQKRLAEALVKRRDKMKSVSAENEDALYTNDVIADYLRDGSFASAYGTRIGTGMTPVQAARTLLNKFKKNSDTWRYGNATYISREKIVEGFREILDESTMQRNHKIAKRLGKYARNLRIDIAKLEYEVAYGEHKLKNNDESNKNLLDAWERLSEAYKKSVYKAGNNPVLQAEYDERVAKELGKGISYRKEIADKYDNSELTPEQISDRINALSSGNVSEIEKMRNKLETLERNISHLFDVSSESIGASILGKKQGRMAVPIVDTFLGIIRDVSEGRTAKNKGALEAAENRFLNEKGITGNVASGFRDFFKNDLTFEQVATKYPDDYSEIISNVKEFQRQRNELMQSFTNPTSGFVKLLTAPTYVFDHLFGDYSPIMKSVFYKPLRDAEMMIADEKTDLMNTFDKFKLSLEQRAYIHRALDAGLTNEQILEDRASDGDGEAIAKAADFVRETLDTTFSRFNEVERLNGLTMTPYRKNYTHHFMRTATNAFYKFMGIDPGVDQLPVEVHGLTADFEPTRKFGSERLERHGEGTDYDMRESLERYLNGALAAIHQTNNIIRLRQLVEATRGSNGREQDGSLAIDRDQNKSANRNKAGQIDDYLTMLANNAAGKKSSLDRPAEQFFGRGFYPAVQGLRQLYSMAVIGGKALTAATNMLPMFQMAAMKPVETLKAFMDVATNSITGRYNASYASKSLRTKTRSASIKQEHGAAKIAAPLYALSGMLDEFTTKVITEAAYNHEVNVNGLNMLDALAQAEQFVDDLQASKTKLSKPEAYNSSLGGLFLQFTQENVNFATFLMKNLKKYSGNSTKKIVANIVGLMLAGYIYNNIFNTNTAPDAIGAVRNAWNSRTEDDNPIDFVVDVGKNLVEQINPYDMLFDEEGNLDLSKAPVISGVKNVFDAVFDVDLLSDGDWESYLTNFMLAAFEWAPGSGQIKTTVGGIRDMARGYSETASGRVKYKLDNNLWNWVVAPVFGSNATPSADDYYEGKSRALTTSKSDVFRAMYGSGKMDIDSAWRYADNASDASKKTNEATRLGKTAGVDAETIKAANESAYEARVAAGMPNNIADWAVDNSTSEAVQVGVSLWQTYGLKTYPIDIGSSDDAEGGKETSETYNGIYYATNSDDYKSMNNEYMASYNAHINAYKRGKFGTIGSEEAAKGLESALSKTRSRIKKDYMAVIAENFGGDVNG